MRRTCASILAGCLALSIPGQFPSAAAPAAVRPNETSILPRTTLATRHFGNDAPWYEANIPFFTCSDAEIEQIYYYRWQLYKAHLKDLGERGYIVTEFLDDVSWSLKPFESLNDATGFHINEGRWLKDRRYVNDYIDFMYHGGNDRHFSEAIADASYDHFLVNGDRAFAVKNLEEMKRIYRQWEDHYDAAKGLYFIEPLLDATEYTISSVDASGGKDGFRGGDAFRPSINSFMFANAMAISKLSALVGDRPAADEFAGKAATLRDVVQKQLWNEGFQHFVDRYKVNNAQVRYWDFIRGRELAGYTPWYFGLPDQDPKYTAAWSHILSPAELGGPFGIRTVEPSYEYYMKQYRYDREDGVNKPECQWNGPSWPFQTTLALGGLANLLNDYPKQAVIGPADYVRLLKQYTKQHYLNGQPDLQEDYNPDTGNVIVGLHRSHHYNHSGYNDLVITGLVGLRPRADDVLEVNPLIPADPNSSNAISYFCLENVLYHGRTVTILYDRDGKHYNQGAGLSVYVNGRRAAGPAPLGKLTVTLPAATTRVETHSPAPADLAVNLTRKGFPAPGASTNAEAANLYQALDGRVWFYPNVRNYWTNSGSRTQTDWFSLDFGQPKTVSSARLYFYGDGQQFKAPTNATLQYETAGGWTDVASAKMSASSPVENGETVLTFTPVEASRLRLVFTNPQDAAVALVEMKVFGTKLTAPNAAPLGLEGFEGRNWHSGEFNGTTWIDADNGGFVAYDLKTTPDAANALVVRYWGSDVPQGATQRSFDILIDGVKIAEQTLNNNRPNQFFEETYAIPENLTKGKTKVKVRFQAHPGAFAGGIFGARIGRR